MRLLSGVAARGLGRNTALALTQALVVMLCLFLSFRLIVESAGIAGLGLWSLLMIFGGVAASFDISGTSALARFVARHEIEFPTAGPAQVIHTVLLTGMAINGAMVALVLLAAPLMLPQLVGVDQLAQSYQLMPWVAALMLLNPLSLGVTTSIDGLKRADLRALLVIVAALCGFMVIAASVSQLGLMSLPLGQLTQQVVTIIGGWIILRRYLPGLGWLPMHWQHAVFRVTTGYALRLNIVGVLGILLEPLTKFCINLAGGTAAVGLYELAARLAMQLRALVVSAAMPLVPALAAIADPASPEAAAIMRRTQMVLALAAGAVAVLSVLGAPVLSLLVLGEISVPVLQMNALLAFGWSMNVLGAGFYLLAQAQGVLRWNLAAHGLIGTSVVAFAIAAGTGNPLGVVAGVAAGLWLSMVATIGGNARQFGLGKLVQGQAAMLGLAIAAIAMCCALAFWQAPGVSGVVRSALQTG